MNFKALFVCAVAAVLAASAPAMAATGFTGAYAYGTWSSSETYGGATVSSVDVTNQVLTLYEPDSYPATPWAPQEFDFSHTVAHSGTVSFDWTFDATVDQCCSGLNVYDNGVLVQNLTGGDFASPYNWNGAVTSGSYSFAVNAGDTITFGAFSADSCCGATVNTISNFNAPGVPEPASWALLLTGVGLAGGALRRRRVATTA